MHLVGIIFVAGLALAAYHAYGMFMALGSFVFYVLVAVAHLIMGPAKPYPHLPVEGWSAEETGYDGLGIPYRKSKKRRKHSR